MFQSAPKFLWMIYDRGGVGAGVGFFWRHLTEGEGVLCSVSKKEKARQRTDGEIIQFPFDTSSGSFLPSFLWTECLNFIQNPSPSPCSSSLPHAHCPLLWSFRYLFNSWSINTSRKLFQIDNFLCYLCCMLYAACVCCCVCLWLPLGNHLLFLFLPLTFSTAAY